jgi:tight adherence protein B
MPVSYGDYKLSFIEYLIYAAGYFSILLVLFILFYDSVIPVFFAAPFIILYYRYIRKYLCSRRKNQLVLQFRDMMNSISVSLSSGYSIENALREAQKEMAVLYGEKSYIYYELTLMNKRLALNIPIEEVFSDFAKRSECGDIFMFSQILVIAKRNGGDLISIIKSSTETIAEKIDINREIETAQAAKRFEQNIMFIMPVAIMLYIRISSPGFFDSVYHNITGISVMSICLAIYFAAVILGLKISSVHF